MGLTANLALVTSEQSHAAFGAATADRLFVCPAIHLIMTSSVVMRSHLAAVSHPEPIVEPGRSVVMTRRRSDWLDLCLSLVLNCCWKAFARDTLKCSAMSEKTSALRSCTR